MLNVVIKTCKVNHLIKGLISRVINALKLLNARLEPDVSPVSPSSPSKILTLLKNQANNSSRINELLASYDSRIISIQEYQGIETLTLQ